MLVFMHACGTVMRRAGGSQAMAVQEVGTDANVFEGSWGSSRFIRLSALRRRRLPQPCQ